jgi:hypothetical protein
MDDAARPCEAPGSHKGGTPAFVAKRGAAIHRQVVAA